MGERLNIEIHRGDKVLANAYYHWSAYTRSALELTQEVISALDEVEEIDPIIQAVRLLEATEAGMSEEEKENLNQVMDTSIFKDCVDRNRGILSITEEGINETRTWQEGRVIIDLDEEMIQFDVCFIDELEAYEDDEVIQLTCLDLMGNVLYDGYFNPIKSSCKKAIMKHKLSKKFLETQPLWKDEWEKINEVLKGKIILAHNAAFDKKLIQQTYQRYGVEFNYISEYRCTMPFLKLKTGQRSLEKVLITLGHDFKEENLHNVRTDCFMLLKALLPTQEVFKLQEKSESMFNRVCRYKKEEKGDSNAVETGWNWIRSKFEISDKYKNFRVLDLKTCQFIIESLDDITQKLNIVNFK